MRLAQALTNNVGTMWCDDAFELLALLSLPAATQSGAAEPVTDDKFVDSFVEVRACVPQVWRHHR